MFMGDISNCHANFGWSFSHPQDRQDAGLVRLLLDGRQVLSGCAALFECAKADLFSCAAATRSDQARHVRLTDREAAPDSLPLVRSVNPIAVTPLSYWKIDLFVTRSGWSTD